MTYRMVITRYKEMMDRTIGKFILLDEDNNIKQEGYTLEPSGPDTTKSNQNRRIPQGYYRTIMRFSPKFKYRTPLLFSPKVDSSRNILIHKGLYPEDTEGCILIGTEFNIYNLSLIHI